MRRNCGSQDISLDMKREGLWVTKKFSVLEFSKLSKKNKSFIVEQLLLNNKLKLNAASLEDRLLENHLLVGLDEADKPFCSSGYKVPHADVQIKLGENLQIFPSTKLTPLVRTKDLQRYLAEGCGFELGWSLNLSPDRKSEFYRLKKQLLEAVSSKVKKREQVFSLVVSKNIAGLKFAQKSGCLPVGQVLSPYSKNILIVNLWLREPNFENHNYIRIP